ncbi:MAG TPA: multiheme c-type cytochrome, partial [Puia sp.]
MGIRKILLLTVIVATVFLFDRCLSGQAPSDPRGQAYAGSATCTRCHGSISTSFAHTAHFLSTRVADSASVAGNFSKDSNELLINDSTRIMMEKRDSGLYQVLYIKNKPIAAHRFDLVMGSVKGQTYLYWKGNGFFQLPVSYFSELHRWTSSPGYSFERLNFNRPIVKECFYCHSSFANGNPHGFSGDDVHQNSWVFNIDCERCHGPAAAHVQFHETHPEVNQARFMTS